MVVTTVNCMRKLPILCHSTKNINCKAVLKEKPYWGNHFWARGYFVSTVGLDEDKITRYIKYQEGEEKNEESEGDNFKLF